MKKRYKALIEELKDQVKSPRAKETKELILFVGAGINFNLTKNGINWDNFIIKSIKTQLNNSKYINHLVANDLYHNNDFKLALMPNKISEKHEFPINNDETWFSDTFKRLEEWIPITFITTNYDTVLSKVTQISSIDALTEGKIKEGAISHIHGKYTDEGISEKSILSLEDYFRNSDQVEKILEDYLKKDKKQKIILIIGMSMNEMHISRVLRKIGTDPDQTTNIYFVTRFKGNKKVCDYVDERFKKIYKIKVINIEASNNYEEDFRSFWELLGADLDKTIFLDEIAGISSIDIATSFTKYNKNKPIEANIKQINFVNDDEKAQFIFKYRGEISQEKFNRFLEGLKIKNRWRYFDSWDLNISPKNKELILQAGPPPSGDDQDFDRVAKYIMQEKQNINIACKETKWIDWFYKKIVDDETIKNVNINWDDLKNKVTLEKVSSSATWKNLAYYPKKDSPFYKVFYQKIESENDLVEKLKERVDNTRDQNFKLVQLINYENIENLDINAYIAKMNKIESKWDKKVFFEGLCLLFLNSKRVDEFVRAIKNETNLPFAYWPSPIDYIGFECSGEPSFSKYDKTKIKDHNFKKDTTFKAVLNKIKLFKQKEGYISRELCDEMIFVTNGSLQEKEVELFKEFQALLSTNQSYFWEYKKIEYKPRNWQKYTEAKKELNENIVNIDPPGNIEQEISNAKKDSSYNEFLELLAIKANYFPISLFDVYNSKSDFAYIFEKELHKDQKYQSKIEKILKTKNLELSLEIRDLEKKVLETKNSIKLTAIVHIIKKIKSDYEFGLKFQAHLLEILRTSNTNIFNLQFLSLHIFGAKAFETLERFYSQHELEKNRNKQKIIEILIKLWLPNHKKGSLNLRTSEILRLARVSDVSKIKKEISQLIINSKGDKVGEEKALIKYSLGGNLKKFTTAAQKIILQRIRIVIKLNSSSISNAPITNYNANEIIKFINTASNYKNITKLKNEIIKDIKNLDVYKEFINNPF